MNIKQYIGIPHKHHGRDKSGRDCYGVTMLIYKNELGIDLPDFDYEEHITIEDFLKIPFISSGWRSTDTVDLFNILAFRNTSHMGQIYTYVGNGIMIHTTSKTGSTATRIKSPHLKRLVGMYRWEGIQ